MKENRKITVAVGRIVVREPAWASILLDREIIEDPTCDTFWTDGIRIGYSPKFLAELTDEEVIGTLVHEVEHIAKLHPWRRNDREHDRWNVACDYHINPELIEARYSLPKGHLINPQFAGMAEEQIYAKLLQNHSGGQPGGQSGQGPSKPGKGKSGSGQGTPGKQSGQGGQGGQSAKQPATFGEVRDCPGTEAEKEEIRQATIVDIIRAASVAKSQGRLPASLASFVESIRHPQISWQELLRNYMTAFARDDYSWIRPNRRYMHTGFYLPSLHSERCGTVAIAIDTSGSIGQNEFEQFMGEVRDILGTMRPEKTLLVQCDAKVQEYLALGSGELPPDKMSIKGGGGTCFAPVFDTIEKEGDSPEVLVYLTDGYGSFPQNPPPYPVIWVMTSDVKGPFGDTIKISVQ